MTELSLEQQRALALANARKRQAETQPQQPRSFIDEAKRQLGLLGRGTTQGLAGVADVFTEPMRYIMNSAGMNIPESTSAATERLISDLPQPETPTERVVNKGVEFLASGMPIIKAGQVSANTGSAIGKMIAQEPATQALSLAGAGTAGQTAREMGAGEGGQFVASLAGGMTPAGIKQASTKAVDAAKVPKQFIHESIPDQNELRTTARTLFDEIDSEGVLLKPDVYEKLAQKVEIISKQMGVHPKITPASHAAMEEVLAGRGKEIKLSDLEVLREIAQNAAKSNTNRKEASIGTQIIEQIDALINDLKPESLIKGDSTGVAEKYRQARDLWGRMRKSEMINRAVDKAENYHSGFENGIRMQFKNILNNDRLIKFFNKQEIEEMKRVSNGDFKGNLTRFLGRFAMTEGKAHNSLMGTMGAGAGYMMGDITGMVIVPAVGQVSRNLAQKLTAGRAAFADDIIRAGKNGDEIIKAYLKNTPKDQRNPDELRELLLRPDVKTPKNIDQVISNVIPISSARRVAPATSAAILANEN